MELFKVYADLNKEDDRLGLEPHQVSNENVKISPKIFTNTLCHFIKILPQKKDISKNLWVKKFIKKVKYSKEEIALAIYCRENPEEKIFTSYASGWVGAAIQNDFYIFIDLQAYPKVFLFLNLNLCSCFRNPNCGNDRKASQKKNKCA